MRTVYKVTVEKMMYDESGDFVRSETLFDASHHRAESLLRFAPVEVETVLEEAAMTNVPQRIVQGMGADPVEPAPIYGGDIPDGVAAEPTEPEPAPAPKAPRKPRAKKAAAPAAEPLPVPATAEAPPAEVEPTPPAAPQWPSAAEVEANHKALDTADAPEPVPAAAAPPADGKPWNPFEVK